MGMKSSNAVIQSIEQSVPLDPSYPTFSERYFTHYHYVPKNQMIRTLKNDELSTNPPQFSGNKTASKDCDSLLDIGCKIPSKKAKLDIKVTDFVCGGHEKTDEQMDIDAAKGGQNHQQTLMENQAANSEYVLNSDKDAGKNGDCIKSCRNLREASTGNDESSAAPDYRLTGEEPLVMVHSNKLCVVSLSSYHPIVRCNKTVAKVEYEVFGVDRLSNSVSGKGKRGAQVMGSKATICRLITEDGCSYNITCGARGKLVQVNEDLLEKPDMARTMCGSDGWLGVVMPKLQDYSQLISALMPAKLYAQMWDKQHT